MKRLFNAEYAKSAENNQDNNCFYFSAFSAISALDDFGSECCHGLKRLFNAEYAKGAENNQDNNCFYFSA
ncbi:MAG: hypothetical protein ACRD3B_03300, partial [Candidatus Sulfotelmatobacter sp.]